MLKPWISKEILRKCKERDSIHKKMDPVKITKSIYFVVDFSFDQSIL